ALYVLHDLHRDRAITSDNLRVIEWVYECQIMLFTRTHRFSIGIVKRIADQNDLDEFAAEELHLRYFLSRCCGRHIDMSFDLQRTTSIGDTLCMITGTRTDYPSLPTLLF